MKVARASTRVSVGRVVTGSSPICERIRDPVQGRVTEMRGFITKNYRCGVPRRARSIPAANRRTPRKRHEDPSTSIGARPNRSALPETTSSAALEISGSAPCLEMTPAQFDTVAVDSPSRADNLSAERPDEWSSGLYKVFRDLDDRRRRDSDCRLRRGRRVSPKLYASSLTSPAALLRGDLVKALEQYASAGLRPTPRSSRRW